MKSVLCLSVDLSIFCFGVKNRQIRNLSTCRQISRFILCRQIVDLVQNFYVGSPLGDLNPLSYPRSKKTWSPPSRQHYASALFLTMLFLLARPRPLVRTGSGYLRPLLEETIDGIIIITLPSDIHGNNIQVKSVLFFAGEKKRPTSRQISL